MLLHPFIILHSCMHLEVMCGPVSGITERLCWIIGGAFEAVWNRELHAGLVNEVVTHCKIKHHS